MELTHSNVGPNLAGSILAFIVSSCSAFVLNWARTVEINIRNRAGPFDLKAQRKRRTAVPVLDSDSVWTVHLKRSRALVVAGGASLER